LQATLETTEAVDTAAVLLREGDFLTTRAAVGIEEEVQRGFTERVGEGFAGKIAAEAQPLVLRHALDDPRVRSQALRDRQPNIPAGALFLSTVRRTRQRRLHATVPSGERTSSTSSR
jgi:hypothetical protein